MPSSCINALACSPRDSPRTSLFILERIVKGTLNPELRWALPRDQQPRSAQLTGISIVAPAATSTEVFITRFCFPPASTSNSQRESR